MAPLTLHQRTTTPRTRECSLSKGCSISLVMRRGREVYEECYKKALELYAQKKSVKEIASELGISYSAVYHWVKGLRKPESGNIRELEAYLKANGPSPMIEIEKKFPKHNELFHVAKERGVPIRRWVTVKPRTFGNYSTWYYLKGQEDELKKRVLDTLRKFGEIKLKGLDEV